MRLGQLLTEPRILIGGRDETDAWSLLREAASKLESNHPLEVACRRLSEIGGVPRRAKLVPGVDLLDLGSEWESPGLVLRVAESEMGRAFSRATWIAWGLSRPSVNIFLYPALRRHSSRIPGTETTKELHEILSSKTFGDNHIETHVTVADVVVPLTYRIYPDAPVGEIEQLMLRRRLAAVPVVGSNHEVLGVITVSDLLPHVLPSGRGRRTSGRDPVTAADVMTRSVLCVSEDEALLVASRSMITRGVSRLPVVRVGELVGFLERDTVLQAFAEAIAAPGRPRAG